MSRKILFLDPFSGISGDMLIGSLLDLGIDLARFHHELGKLNLTGYRLASRQVMRGAMSATKFDVEIEGQLEGANDATPEHSHDHGHSHGHSHGHEHSHSHASADAAQTIPLQRTFLQIKEIIERSSLSSGVKEMSVRSFAKLAEAEGRIHNMPPEQVHFHEVGALDSIIDMVGACIGLELLGIEEVWCGPLALGSGFVKCQHGLMPVPAPATLELVKGIPLRASPVEKELTTPTGAALVAALATRFISSPQMEIQKIGYGAGSRVEQAVPNVLRALLGVSVESGDVSGSARDTVIEIQTNVDDASPEVMGYVSERLFAAGALDVFFTAVQMKKNRPGLLITVLSAPELLDAVADILFRECPTFGLRYQTLSRLKLDRRIETVKTSYGDVRVKVGTWRGRETSVHPEYEDCRLRAQEKNVALREVIEAAKAAYHSRKS